MTPSQLYAIAAECRRLADIEERWSAARREQMRRRYKRGRLPSRRWAIEAMKREDRK